MSEFRPKIRMGAVRIAIAVVILLALTPLVGLAFTAFGASAPTYAVEDGALVVRSGQIFSGTRTVRLSDVTDTRLVALAGGRRVAGTALPGLCAGHYSYPTLGDVWQVTTCSRQGVLVRATGAEYPIVVSPPDAKLFIDQLHAGTPMVVSLPPASMGHLKIVFGILVPLGLITLLMVAAVMVLGPSRMRYIVSGGTFEVITLFGRQSWPIAGAAASAYTPKGLLRVAGTGAPGYYTGRFRESGKATRVYATETTNVVLFERDAARVIVSPEDREGFLIALEKAGAKVTR